MGTGGRSPAGVDSPLSLSAGCSGQCGEVEGVVRMRQLLHVMCLLAARTAASQEPAGKKHLVSDSALVFVCADVILS